MLQRGIDLALELVDRLAETLNSEGVVYCQWKSNFSLARALSGGTDLDLLVERRSCSRALAILTHLGFKPATVRSGPGTPGVSHYYGLDMQTGQLSHVHLFSRVLTGESLVKSHLLPFEPMLLENADHIGRIRVPSKAAELVLFVLRTFIKYGSLLDLVYLFQSDGQIRAELRWLQRGGDASAALAMLGKYCPVIDEPLFAKCIDTLDGPTSLAERIMVARQVRQRLGVYSRHSAFRHVLAYAQPLWEQGWRRLDGNRKDKMPHSGGAIIAFVGPEATGKSTLVSMCGRWLGSVFAVKTVHAGKPPSSWLTAPMNIVVPLMRRLLPRLRSSHLASHGFAANPSLSQPQVTGLPALVYAFGAVILAWDRRQLLLKARRAAANGEIVICDRYPSETIGAMDSPRLRESPANSGMISAVHNRLVRLERRLYKQIPPPDIVLRLKVSIETAKKRNRERIKAGNETDAYVESRHRQSQDWYKPGTKYIYDIDTDEPLAETILSVKKAIWEVL